MTPGAPIIVGSDHPLAPGDHQDGPVTEAGMVTPGTRDTMRRQGCLSCGAPGPASGLCSTHCRVEADLEVRRIRARARYLRRRPQILAKDRFELRSLDDRNAELQEALVASAPQLRN